MNGEKASGCGPCDVRLLMRYEKALPSAQGMAVYDNMAFILYHTGVCAIYDLVTGVPTPLAVFPLGSANDGVGGKEYINHSNQCMFGSAHFRGNSIPLMYVTTGNAGGGDADGYYYRCAVEDIRLVRDEDGRVSSASSTLVQTYCYRDEGLENTGWRKPCWGCPAWFADTENMLMHIFSARYRTTEEFLSHCDENCYRVTTFPMASPEQRGTVRLSAADILDQFDLPFDILFTQGGTLRDGKIYYTFGMGNERYPVGLRIYDLKRRACVQRLDLSDTIMGAEEIECCAFHNGELLCNTNADPGGIYALGAAGTLL